VINGNSIQFFLNEMQVSYEGSLDRTLLDVLREDFGLMGTKNGCGTGHCGACTVIINGKAKKACITKMSRVDQAHIETIEGLSRNGELHPLQIAFVNCGAIQCGFCTPGMIMSAKALLDINENPTDEDIKDALKGNICRCTGYVKIIEAVKLAARAIRTKVLLKLNTDTDGLGNPVIRKDGIEKAKGSPIYTDDMKFEGALYGELVLSEKAHAYINAIDVSEAKNLAGVVAVLTASDIPGPNLVGIITKKQPILAHDKVRYLGDAVALVLAEDRETAQKASKLVKVKYTDLSPIFDMHVSRDSKDIFIHEDGNILSELHIVRGDVNKGFQEADVILETEINLPAIEHAYMEPDSVYSVMQDDGILTVYTQSQSSFSFRDEIAENLQIPQEKIRVITRTTGGAFGGREEPTIQIHAALGTFITGRPVRMVMSRYDVMLRTSKRHAERLTYKIGATKSGKITALQTKIIADTGAYPSAGEAVILRSVLFASGPYEIQNADIHGCCVYTNTTPAGAMRGFGSNQPAVASEIIMDMLAEKLSIDPIELRLLNALDVGSQTIGGQVLTSSVGIKKTLIEVKKALKEEKIPELSEFTVGVGIASAMKNVGLGSGMNDSAGATAELQGNHVLLRVASVDSGQGSDTVVRQIASEVLHVPSFSIELVTNDTARTVDGGVTTASRQTFVTGNAVKIATESLKQCVLKKSSDVLNLSQDEIDFVDYRIINRTTKKTLLTSQEVFDKFGPLAETYTYRAPDTSPISVNTDNKERLDEAYRLHFSYCYGTQAVIVAVHPKTGEVKVLKVIAAHDTGKIINLHGVEGQLEGGIVMGMGYALSESYIMNEQGVVTDTLRKIGVPSIDKTPVMKTILVENEHPQGPFGAKGLGELVMIPTTPAIINAIYHACGVRITSLPATPERILDGLERVRQKNR
jgi:CO/xanthine dehydrogenase Mo-binding subunit/aerobic-type carbon monoxide dehydrogenase small subunit (CoxS/CutS family)